VWGLVGEADRPAAGPPDGQEDIERLLHRTIRKVTSDTESLDYNTAIAAMMEYVTALREGAPARSLVEPLVVMLAPYAPHFAEECWERLGHATSVMDGPWPAFDEALAAGVVVELVVQVNGRVRGRLQLPRGAAQADVVAAATAEPGVQRFVAGREVRKVVFVPDRLLNLVVSDAAH
jgi:leucyl-tRNA synthetase